MTGVENLVGSDFGDIMVGSSGNNTIAGGAGDDKLYGVSGNDVFEPGTGSDFIAGSPIYSNIRGWDVADYAQYGAAVYVTLSDTLPYDDNGTIKNLNYAIGEGGEIDYLESIEYVRGSNFDDTIIGSGPESLAGYNWLAGWGGNDTIEGRGWIDDIFGGTGDDVLKGGSGDDNLYGWTDNDTLYGDAGMDELYGEGGDDTLWGGTNTDTFVFAIGGGNDTVEDFQDNYDVLKFTGGLTFLDLTITDDVGGALISYGASDSVLVMNMAAANLTETDMAFV
jgi:Ca2+-binding RTX toxin-like protein